MLKFLSRSGLAAGLAAALSLAPAAVAQPLLELVSPDPFTTYVQVNGTSGSDLLLLEPLPDGSILLLRLANDIRLGLIDSATASSLVTVVMARGGNDIIEASNLAPPVILEIWAGAGDDLVLGSKGHDLIVGDDAGEVGNDLLYGGPGNDTIWGGRGFYDILIGGPGHDSLADEDGVALAQGDEGDDSISVIFEAAWDNNSNPNDVRRVDGIIAPGGGDDFVQLIVLGSPIRFNINADGGTANPGSFDFLEAAGPVDPASVFTNFEGQAFFP